MLVPIFLFLLSLDVKQVNLEKAVKFHTAKADYFYHKGNYPEMLYHLSEKIKYDPLDLNTWSDIAFYYWSLSVDDKVRRQEFQSKALKSLNNGLQVNSKSAFMWDELARFYMYCYKDFKTPINYFNEAIKRDDVEPVSYHFLAQCYFKNGETHKAIETMENCVKRFPEDLKGKSDLNKYKGMLSGS